MAIGDPADPVDSDVAINNPLPQTVIDSQRGTEDRLKVLERTGNAELARQIEWLYTTLGYPYPPP